MIPARNARGASPSELDDVFLQIDRCNAGVRLTIRKGEGRSAPGTDTLVRQPYMGDGHWDSAKTLFVVGHPELKASTPLHAWKEHKLLGTVQDLMNGKINEDADHG